jgi:hypothetical protein
LWEKSSDSIKWQTLIKGNIPAITHSADTAGIFFYRFFAAKNENDLNNDFCKVYSSVFKVTTPQDTFYVNDTLCENAKYTFGSRSLDAGGNYREIFKSRLGCDSTVLLNLTIVPSYIIQNNKEVKDPKCFNTNTGSLDLQNITGGFAPSKINLSNDKKVPIKDFAQLAAGKYYLSISDKNLCTNTDSFEIFNPEQFKINLGNDTTMYLGTPVNLNILSNYKISRSDWTPGSFENGKYIPQNSEYIQLKAYNTLGCIAIDSLKITVDKNIPIYYSNIVNLNSNNPKNRSFTFSIPGIEALGLQEFNLFDRFGNQLLSLVDFKDSSLDLSSLSSMSISDGVYAFVMKARLWDQSIKYFTGSVFITR